MSDNDTTLRMDLLRLCHRQLHLNTGVEAVDDKRGWVYVYDILELLDRDEEEDA